MGRPGISNPPAIDAGLPHVNRLLLIATLFLAAPVVAVEATPTVFVTSLYRAYANSDADPLGRGAGRIFTPSLLALIRADRAPAGEVGKLDYDPICACQDADGLTLLSVAVGSKSETKARATARFRIRATIRTVDLALVKTRGGWRVDDVRSAGAESLRRYLSGAAHR